MEVIVSKIIPVLITVVILAATMAAMTGIGWVSGKVIRKLLGIGGK
jgi:hypothetical protein